MNVDNNTPYWLCCGSTDYLKHKPGCNEKEMGNTYRCKFGTSEEHKESMSNIKTVEIVKIYPTKYWVEKDFFGSSHIMVQHETMQPFCYASFHYDYAYTSNAGVRVEVVNMMKRFGVEEKDIEYKSRGFK